jgi:sec-independent protein translocase protein TatB
MEILNVGPWELGLILILALIVLGPEGMAKTSRQVARWIAKIIKSPIWKELISTSEEIRTIPQKFVKEANLEETMQEVSKLTRKPLIPDFTKEEEVPAEIPPAEESKKEPDQSTDQ